MPKSDVIGLEKAGQAYLAIFKNQPTVSRAQKYKVYSPEFYNEIYGKAQPWQIAAAHEIYRFAETKGRRAYRELAPDDPSRNILNYGVFHICRILWWVLVNELDMNPRDEAAAMAAAREENDLLETAYIHPRKFDEKGNTTVFDLYGIRLGHSNKLRRPFAHPVYTYLLEKEKERKLSHLMNAKTFEDLAATKVFEGEELYDIRSVLEQKALVDGGLPIEEMLDGA